jgi:hypothetical protein
MPAAARSAGPVYSDYETHRGGRQTGSVDPILVREEETHERCDCQERRRRRDHVVNDGASAGDPGRSARRDQFVPIKMSSSGRMISP